MYLALVKRMPLVIDSVSSGSLAHGRFVANPLALSKVSAVLSVFRVHVLPL